MPDPALGKYRQEAELFDEQVPNLVYQTFALDVPEHEEQEDHPQISTTPIYEIA